MFINIDLLIGDDLFVSFFVKFITSEEYSCYSQEYETYLPSSDQPEKVFNLSFSFNFEVFIQNANQYFERGHSLNLENVPDYIINIFEFIVRDRRIALFFINFFPRLRYEHEFQLINYLRDWMSIFIPLDIIQDPVIKEGFPFLFIKEE